MAMDREAWCAVVRGVAVTHDLATKHMEHARWTVKSERGALNRCTWTTGIIWKVETTVTLILINNLSEHSLI